MTANLSKAEVKQRFFTAESYYQFGLNESRGTAATVNMAFAGEKYLKLLLHLCGISPTPTHDYVVLVKQLSANPAGQQVQDLIFRKMYPHGYAIDQDKFDEGLRDHRVVFKTLRYYEERDPVVTSGWLDHFVRALRATLLDHCPYL